MDYTGRPQPPTFANVETGEIVELQFNPVEVNEEVSADYSSAKIIGYSSRPLQYGGTNNVALKSMAIAFDARFNGGSIERTEEARKFFLSLMFPMRGTTIATAGTPRVQLTYPKVSSYTGKVMGVKNAWSFERSGRLIACTITLDFEGDPPHRIYSDDVRKKGLWF